MKVILGSCVFGATSLVLGGTLSVSAPVLACDTSSPACNQSLFSPNSPAQPIPSSKPQTCQGSGCNASVPIPPLPSQGGYSNTTQTSTTNSPTVVNTNVGGSAINWSNGSGENRTNLGDCSFGNANAAFLGTVSKAFGGGNGIEGYTSPGAFNAGFAFSTPVGNTGKGLCQKTYATKTATAKVAWCQDKGSKAPRGGWQAKHFPDMTQKDAQAMADLCNEFVTVEVTTPKTETTTIYVSPPKTTPELPTNVVIPPLEPKPVRGLW